MSQRDDHIVERLEASDLLSKCGQELRALESEAGIANQANKAREGANFPLIGDNHPNGSRKQRDDDEAYWENERLITDSRLRRAYFSVPDLEMRRKLIAKDAECGELRRNNFRIDLRQAEEQLMAAQASGQYWWIWACATGSFLVVIGVSLFGTPGALITALAAFFYGKYLEDVAMRKRALAVRTAQQEVDEARSDLDEILNEPPRFTSTEKNGQMDAALRA
jgi:hypothetical protein